MKPSEYTKKFLRENNIVPISLLFLAWRIWTTVFAYLGFVLLPLKGKDLFGGGLDHYLYNPGFWGWSNFDGEHYVSIAQSGYKFLEHSFFPLYPLILHLISPTGMLQITWTGLILSNVAFFISLVLLWRLLRLDYSLGVSWWSLVALVSFPTSFYFGSVYTSSVFLLFSLIAFLCARKFKWFYCGVAGALASATSIFGLVLTGALFIEWVTSKQYKPFLLKNTLALLCVGLTLLGLIAYMWYLFKVTGSPLSFYSELSPFGQQREIGRIIFFPQVFWRYFKMIATVDKTNPIYPTVLIEFFTSAGTLALIAWGLKTHLRRSYWVYCVLGYLLSTSTGSFSSLPRYVVILFPLFLLIGKIIAERKLAKFLILASFIFLLAFETMLFTRGYWVG